MDLTAAINRIEELALEGKRTTILTTSVEPDDMYYLCEPGKPPVLKLAHPGPRAVLCDTIDGVCQSVTELNDQEGGTPFVYVGKSGVVAHLDETGDRRDTVSMPFTKTDQMEAVENLAMSPIKQAELVWLLRSTLAGCCEHPQFATMVRKLRCKSNEEGERTIAVGRESIGASVVKEMAGIEGDLPETITFSVPVYEEVWHDMDSRKRHHETIELAVHVDLSEMAFVFRPTGSSVKDARLNARRQALVQFREKLEGAATVIEESTFR